MLYIVKIYLFSFSIYSLNAILSCGRYICQKDGCVYKRLVLIAICHKIVLPKKFPLTLSYPNMRTRSSLALLWQNLLSYVLSLYLQSQQNLIFIFWKVLTKCYNVTN